MRDRIAGSFYGITMLLHLIRIWKENGSVYIMKTFL